jgi:hypothetical protein
MCLVYILLSLFSFPLPFFLGRSVILSPSLVRAALHLLALSQLMRVRFVSVSGFEVGVWSY